MCSNCAVMSYATSRVVVDLPVGFGHVRGPGGAGFGGRDCVSWGVSAVRSFVRFGGTLGHMYMYLSSAYFSVCHMRLLSAVILGWRGATSRAAWCIVPTGFCLRVFIYVFQFIMDRGVIFNVLCNIPDKLIAASPDPQT